MPLPHSGDMTILVISEEFLFKFEAINEVKNLRLELYWIVLSALNDEGEAGHPEGVYTPTAHFVPELLFRAQLVEHLLINICRNDVEEVLCRE